jgi:putative tricarboxylic transport membrane protein
VKFNDALVGAALVVLAAAIFIYIRGFPPMPGQKFGAALFPGLIAAGLLATGALLIARGVRQGSPLIALAPWTRSRSLLGNFALVCGALVFYLLAADTLGFLPTGVLILLALFLKLGVPAARAAVVAIVTTLVIHTVFYRTLKVPLPWGLLESIAW